MILGNDKYITTTGDQV